MIGVYFHCYVAGSWETPTLEFLESLHGLEEHGPLHLGLVGPVEEREKATSMCREFMSTRVIAQADEGWEQLTLNALHANPVGDHILYAHTKGAAIVDDWQDAWRRSMFLSLVYEWEQCLPHLEEYDCVGDHWLLPTQGMPQRYPFFGGNVWWARRTYIETLNPPDTTSRYDAEAWIGSGEGVQAYVRQSRWPGWDTIRQEVRAKPERIRL